MNSPTLDDKNRRAHVLIKTFELIQHWNIVSKKATVFRKCFGSRTRVGSWCIFLSSRTVDGNIFVWKLSSSSIARPKKTFVYGINVYFIQQKGELIPNFLTFQPLVYFQNQNIRFLMFFQIFCFFFGLVESLVKILFAYSKQYQICFFVE